VFTTIETYPWPFVTQMFVTVNQVNGDRKTFEVMTSA